MSHSTSSMSSSACSIVICTSNQTNGNLDSSGCCIKWCLQDFMYVVKKFAHMQEMMPFWWSRGQGGVPLGGGTRAADLVLPPALVEHHPLHYAREAPMIFNHTHHLPLKLLLVCSNSYKITDNAKVCLRVRQACAAPRMDYAVKAFLPSCCWESSPRVPQPASIITWSILITAKQISHGRLHVALSFSHVVTLSTRPCSGSFYFLIKSGHLLCTIANAGQEGSYLS